jgi:hypothetical protein
VGGGLVERREAPRGAHDERSREPRIDTDGRERHEVFREHGAEVGVDRGRRCALVLAELGCHLV